MTWHSYLLFCGASLVLCATPGPDMIYLLSRCVAQGRRAGVVAALGINTGAYVHLLAAVTGLSAILATSAVAFTVVKWIGAAYLVFLGARILMGRATPLAITGEGLRGDSLKAIFWQGFLSDALNPKVALFFLALLPQFLPAGSTHRIADLLVLGMTCIVIGLAFNLGLALASAGVTQGLRRRPRAAGWLQKGMGAMFVGIGVSIAAEHA
jgi:threonine/homoserine/homoserine lactone efflux protein